MNGAAATRRVVFMGVFVAVIAALSQFSIPTPTGVPLTLQTLAVALAGYVLGPQMGLGAVAAYLLLGAVGVPVFAGFGSGVGVLFGVPGGFLWGFLPMAFLLGLSMGFPNGMRRAALGALGLGLCHVCGILQYMAVTKTGFLPAFAVMSAPYLPKDAASVAIACLSAVAIRRALVRANLAHAIHR